MIPLKALFFSFILSWRGLIFLSLLLLLFWLCQDYPTWRNDQINKNNTQSRSNHHDNDVAPQFQQQQYDESSADKKKPTDNENYENNMNEDDKDDRQRPKKKDELALIHYILAMPLATVYIVIRALLDCIRNVVFWTLWFLEKSAPVIDAWLFDKVTVWLPKKYQQCETWWLTRGVYAWQNTKNYVVHTAIPTTVYCIDQTCIGTVHVCRRINKTSIQFGDAWQRFAKQHDWKQLANDMADVWLAIVWQPIVWAISRGYRLGAMIYYGGRNVLWSLKDDIQWLITVAIPSLWKAVTDTELYGLVSEGASWFSIHSKWIIAKVLQQVVLPLLHNMRRGSIVLIDVIALIVGSDSFQTRLQKIRTIVLSNMIWWIEEQINFFTDNINLLLRVAKPCATYFGNELLPALTEAYKRLTKWLWDCYISYIRPALTDTYYFIQPTMIIAYKYASDIASVPFITIWEFVQTVGSVTWDAIQRYCQHSIMAAIPLIQQSSYHTWLLSKQFYTQLTLWLDEQAPYIMDAFSKACNLAITNGWALVTFDSAGMKEQIIHASELMFESLERIISEWIKEQSQPTGTTTTGYDHYNEKKIN
ncbi:hypothetical protein BDA99DRAFT_495913 [Phascolomyces articulosus]|uniref:Uncharacterized protein n=1 Tax=Phascolomyces articulosus TaxID=60185 RepID=A0AAD5KMM2_9FUNG|nr:hypothetical protein BDA99DRAFT_495913 [Phascolomyces articulosus]